MVGSGLSAQEAYEAVPQLADRGEKVLQNLRKRAREARALLEATAAPPKPAKPRAKKQKKPPAVLPKGKRLRTDQVDAISAQKVEKRQRRSDACTLSSATPTRQSHTLGVVGAYVVVNFVICEHKFSMSATNCSTTIRLKSSSRVSRDLTPWRARTVNVERLGCEHAAVSPLAVSASA